MVAKGGQGHTQKDDVAQSIEAVVSPSLISAMNSSSSSNSSSPPERDNHPPRPVWHTRELRLLNVAGLCLTGAVLEEIRRMPSLTWLNTTDSRLVDTPFTPTPPPSSATAEGDGESMALVGVGWRRDADSGGSRVGQRRAGGDGSCGGVTGGREDGATDSASARGGAGGAGGGGSREARSTRQYSFEYAAPIESPPALRFSRVPEHGGGEEWQELNALKFCPTSPWCEGIASSGGVAWNLAGERGFSKLKTVHADRCVGASSLLRYIWMFRDSLLYLRVCVRVARAHTHANTIRLPN